MFYVFGSALETLEAQKELRLVGFHPARGCCRSCEGQEHGGSQPDWLVARDICWNFVSDCRSRGESTRSSQVRKRDGGPHHEQSVSLGLMTFRDGSS
jgi:hypothetical protein